ncbi:hypothetical protein [Halorubrum saccharovorum]|uniref:hypothetical protein n=1 Tax=Halorubrum saccharovorum TaxID=2248 RepID=UPI001EF9E901|nr:hypothetical protein [Halorubrum saccharovorum]
MTGSAAATVDISSSNPDTLESDAGEVDEVFIEPSLSVTWDGMDDVVGKVRVLIEATTGEVDLDPPEIESLEYMPVFRATGYANGTSNESEDESGPGTNGEFHIDWFDGDEQISVYDDDDGAPDYEAGAYNCGATMESYLDGTLMGDPIDAQNGYYGAAGTTDAFEAETDTGTTTTTVYLRYTISLHAPDASFITEDRYDLDAEDVRPHSPIVMVGGDQDQYPDLSGDEYGTTVTADEAEDYDDLEAGDFVAATAVPYDTLQESTDHPAIMSAHTHFDVTVDNEAAEAGVSGESSAGASVDEEVGTIDSNESTDGNATGDN